VATASKYGAKVLLTLTNNWNPSTPAAPGTVGRIVGFLEYIFRMITVRAPIRACNPVFVFSLGRLGRIDLFVQAFHSGGTHNMLYPDPTIINALKNSLSHAIPRYANNPAVLGWELGNDLRWSQRSSTFPPPSTCITAGVSKWVADICEQSIRCFI
jgi:mannan endo-1,4-beta-mannosidase